MGFSVSYLAFRGVARPDILARAGLRDTGVRDEANEAPFSLAELPTGWTVLYANDVEYPSPERLGHLSRGCDVVACQAEEHAMVSVANGWAGGREVWQVAHDGMGGDRDHLRVTGAAPPELPLIRRRLGSEQGRAGRTADDVDHGFGVPVELVAALTGYRYDETRFAWGEPRFTRLEPSGSRPGFRRWLPPFR